LALSNIDGSTAINVSRDLVCSSILRPSDLCVEAHPSSVTVSEETVTVRQLDSIIGTLLVQDDRLYLKIDTQGSELEVLRGGLTTLATVLACEVEVSLRPVYVNQPLLPDIFAFLNERGFHAVWAERGLLDQSGDMLQLDVLFTR